MHRVVNLKFYNLSHEASDIVQEVHFRLFHNLKSKRFEGRSSLKWYVQRMTMKVCCDILRKTRPVIALGNLDDPPQLQASGSDPLDDVVSNEKAEAYAWILKNLSDRSRQVILLRLRGLKYTTIAHIFGVPEGTVKSRLSRAIDEAQELLEKWKMRERSPCSSDTNKGTPG